jgi:hypothetical protein
MKNSATKAAARSPLEEKAIYKISDYFCELYALDDLARRYDQLPLSHITIQEAVNALCGEIIAALDCVARSLPRRHPALAHLRAAQDSFAALGDFMIAIQRDDGIAMSKEAAGQAMLAINIRAGAAMDLAIVACNGGRETALVSGYAFGDVSDPNVRASDAEVVHA